MKIIGCGLLVIGIGMAPLVPFWGLLIIPFLLLWYKLPASALAFSILLDSFLVPGSIAPLWTSLTLYVILFLPLCIYLRYTTNL